MNKKTGYKIIPLTFNRKAVIASANVTKEKNTFHCITEVDVSVPRKVIIEYFQKTGVKLSLTAYIVTCLAQVIKDHPSLNSFIKGGKQIILEDVTVSVLIEREIKGEKVPEPCGLHGAPATGRQSRESHSAKHLQYRTRRLPFCCGRNVMGEDQSRGQPRAGDLGGKLHRQGTRPGGHHLQERPPRRVPDRAGDGWCPIGDVPATPGIAGIPRLSLRRELEKQAEPVALDTD